MIWFAAALAVAAGWAYGLSRHADRKHRWDVGRDLARCSAFCGAGAITFAGLAVVQVVIR